MAKTEIELAEAIEMAGGLLLISQGLLKEVENWVLDQLDGTSNFPAVWAGFEPMRKTLADAETRLKDGAPPQSKDMANG